MDAHKDYYASLGLLPDADVALIKAAYRVLAKKYHPDSSGEADEASKQKFFEIKEAYDVLKYADKRRAYDKSRDDRQKRENDLSAAQKDGGVEIDPDERWDRLSELHPGLDQTYRNLHSISVGLANGFRLSVLEAKDPASFKEIAAGLEKKFLRKYFSPHLELQNLAKRLLLEGSREQARQLNSEIKSSRHLSLKKRRELIKQFQPIPKSYRAKPSGSASDSGDSQARERQSSSQGSTAPKRQRPERPSRGAFASTGQYITAVFGFALTLLALTYLYAGQEPRGELALPEKNATQPAPWSPVQQPVTSESLQSFVPQQDAKSTSQGRKMINERLLSGDGAKRAEQNIPPEQAPNLNDLFTNNDIRLRRDGPPQPFTQVPSQTPADDSGNDSLPLPLPPSSKGQAWSQASVEDVCFEAVDSRTSSWSTGTDPKVVASVEEAKRRNLSVNDCLAVLGLPAVDGRQKERSTAITIADQTRMALVIGNNSYSSITALDTAGNDAQKMAAALEDIGFKVSLALDASREAMEAQFARFAQESRVADTVLVYYAGHGIQHKGRNYLVPVDGTLEDETDLRYLIELQTVIDDIGRGKPQAARFLILDACRDNYALTSKIAEVTPTRSANFGTGLAKVAADGVLIAYATQPGRVAVDTIDGQNSPFTKALINHIKTPGIDVRVMLARVRAEVLAATNGKQRPETSDSLVGEFQFRPE